MAIRVGAADIKVSIEEQNDAQLLPPRVVMVVRQGTWLCIATTARKGPQ